METPVEQLSDYELERGKPIPSKNHNRIQHRLNVELAKRYDTRYDLLPEQNLELSTGDSVPDLCIYPNLTYNWEEDEIRMTEPPITTIEILSPKQAFSDLVEKIRKIYFPAGVKSAWIIVPPVKTIHVFYPSQPTQTFASGTIKDEAAQIELPLEEVFK